MYYAVLYNITYKSDNRPIILWAPLTFIEHDKIFYPTVCAQLLYYTRIALQNKQFYLYGIR